MGDTVDEGLQGGRDASDRSGSQTCRCRAGFSPKPKAASRMAKGVKEAVPTPSS
jgi:hypothetical protein